ncbi:BTAD domain-containing putative transcriptional regulator [Nonomuraea sp. NPDC050451]|uniref:BTAD domain-containing putative transcriptional regulator n=1 Tax=Nonomuraea sp. NPDC050451 TaxID=3364364 RepID=UPI003794B769
MDATRFTTLAGAGRRAFEADRPAEAAELLEQALSCWTRRSPTCGPRSPRIRYAILNEDLRLDAL